MLAEETRNPTANVPFTLKIVKPTTFKQDLVQSSELPEDKKFVVEEVPQELSVLAYTYENQHYKVSFADRTLKGFNTWYVYKDHIELLDQAGKIVRASRPGSLAERVVACCEERGYPLDRGAGEINLIGIEAMDLDGSPNQDAPNVFNDLIGCLIFENDQPMFKGLYVGTTEPGRYYTTQKLLNAQGAARLEFGQHQCWQTGLHNGKYEALIQTGAPVTVRRDGNKDFSREGDVLDTGSFGINIHHGGDNPANDIGLYSAGCQVIRSTNDFAEFMRIVKDDPRWQVNSAYIFKYTLLWGGWL